MLDIGGISSLKGWLDMGVDFPGRMVESLSLKVFMERLDSVPWSGWHRGVWSEMGLDGLRGLFQPYWFPNSVILFHNQIIQKDLVSLKISWAESFPYGIELKQVSEDDVPSFYKKFFLYKRFYIKLSFFFCGPSTWSNGLEHCKPVLKGVLESLVKVIA